MLINSFQVLCNIRSAAIFLLFCTVIQSVYALDVDKLLSNQQTENNTQAENERDKKIANSPEVRAEVYLKSHDYPTMQDFLDFTKNKGRSQLKEWDHENLQVAFVKSIGEDLAINHEQERAYYGNQYKPVLVEDRLTDLLDLSYSLGSRDMEIARSSIVKTLLEKEYGVVVPFKKASFTAQSNPELFRQSNGGIRQARPTLSCAGTTPILLAGGMYAAGNYTVFSADKNAAKAEYLAKPYQKYLAWLFNVLKDRCAAEDHTLNGEKSFIDSYKKFLNDYTTALEAGNSLMH